MEIGKKIDKFRSMVTLNKDEFIRIQIIKRRKDNPSLPYSEKTIKLWYFYSWDDVVKKIDEIKEVCDHENARAYIRLNKQNSVDLTLRTVTKMIENNFNGCSHKNFRAWDSMAGKGGSNEWWVLDVDSHHLIESENDNPLEVFIKQLETHFEMVKKDPKKSIVTIPTKSGKHIIIKRFDRRILDTCNNNLIELGVEPINYNKNGETILYWKE